MSHGLPQSPGPSLGGTGNTAGRRAALTRTQPGSAAPPGDDHRATGDPAGRVAAGEDLPGLPAPGPADSGDRLPRRPAAPAALPARPGRLQHRGLARL